MYWYGYDRMRNFLIWSGAISVGITLGIIAFMILCR